MIIGQERGGGHFFDIFDPPPSLKTSKKWMDGWMERKYSGGCIPRTQAMMPKLRAHDSDRFTVLGQAATGV